MKVEKEEIDLYVMNRIRSNHSCIVNESDDAPRRKGYLKSVFGGHLRYREVIELDLWQDQGVGYS